MDRQWRPPGPPSGPQGPAALGALAPSLLAQLLPGLLQLASQSPGFGTGFEVAYTTPKEGPSQEGGPIQQPAFGPRPILSGDPAPLGISASARPTGPAAITGEAGRVSTTPRPVVTNSRPSRESPLQLTPSKPAVEKLTPDSSGKHLDDPRGTSTAALQPRVVIEKMSEKEKKEKKEEKGADPRKRSDQKSEKSSGSTSGQDKPPHPLPQATESAKLYQMAKALASEAKESRRALKAHTTVATQLGQNFGTQAAAYKKWAEEDELRVRALNKTCDRIEALVVRLEAAEAARSEAAKPESSPSATSGQ